MTKNIINSYRLIGILLMSILLLPSCKDDRDVQESLKNKEVNTTPKEKHNATFSMGLDFSLEAPSVELPDNQGGLRALNFKLESAINDFSKKRTMSYEYDDGDEVDALLMLRCKGLKVETSETNSTPKDLPYMYAFIKLTYHTKENCTHQYPEGSPKAGQAVPKGAFICNDNEIKFTWYGDDFEDIKSNTADRKWQVRIFLNSRLGEVKPTAEGETEPKSYEIPVGDETEDSRGSLDADTPNDTDEGRKRKEIVDLYDMYAYDDTVDGLQSVEKLARDTDVPFLSDWRDIEFARYDHNGNKLTPTQIAQSNDKPFYGFNVPEGEPHIRLKPRGVFIMVAMTTANDTPFPMVGRGINIQTSTFSFAGKYDFSEQTLRANNGEPRWLPSAKQLVPNQADDKLVKEYVKNFQFADPEVQGKMKEIDFPKRGGSSEKKYFLFWAMPNDIEGAQDEDYITQLYLNSHYGGEITTGYDESKTSSEEKTMYIPTNYNIRKVDEGRVAAIMPVRPVDGHTFTAEDILQGKGGNAQDYINHGIVGNRRVWLHLPSVKSYPIYSSIGKCIFKRNVTKEINGEQVLVGKQGELKHGRILYAQTYNLTRPIIFLEYMAETPSINTGQLDEQVGKKAGADGNYWEENAQMFPYDGADHHELLAYRLNPHWNLMGDKSDSNFAPTGNNEERCDEFHFDYFDAEDLANGNVYGYMKKIPESIAMGTYFRQYMDGTGEGYVPEQELVPSPIVHNSRSEYYYRIRFRQNGNRYVIEDVGENQPVELRLLDNNNDAQYWLLISNSNNRNQLIIRNKETRRFMAYQNGRIKAISYYDPSTEYGLNNFSEFRLYSRYGNTLLKSNNMAGNKSINAYQGARLNAPVSEYYDNGVGNALDFVDVNGSVKNAGNVRISKGVGPYNINQNFPSRIAYENTDKVRPTFVRRGDAGYRVYYAVRYMDHEDGITCTEANHRPSALHEDGDWRKCNNRRCVVRYERGREFDRSQIWNNKSNNSWILQHKNDISEAALYSITARYVGKADGLASRKNPIWAREDFWQHNNIDDVVRYYTSYGYIYQGNYVGTGVMAFYWSGQPTLSGAQDKCNDILNMDCRKVSLGYYGFEKFAGHAYACVDRQNRPRQDRIGFYLFMNIKDWTDMPEGFDESMRYK